MNSSLENGMFEMKRRPSSAAVSCQTVFGLSPLIPRKYVRQKIECGNFCGLMLLLCLKLIIPINSV